VGLRYDRPMGGPLLRPSVTAAGIAVLVLVSSAGRALPPRHRRRPGRNGLLEALRLPGLLAAERSALDRIALNIWLRFTR
jgi:hypothetical protein